MSDWLEALRVASESTAIDLVTAGVLDEIRHALVVGRLIDREDLDYGAAAQHLSTLIYQSPEGSWPDEFLPYAKVESRKIVDAAIGGSDEK